MFYSRKVTAENARKQAFIRDKNPSEEASRISILNQMMSSEFQSQQ